MNKKNLIKIISWYITNYVYISSLKFIQILQMKTHFDYKFICIPVIEVLQLNIVTLVTKIGLCYHMYNSWKAIKIVSILSVLYWNLQTMWPGKIYVGRLLITLYILAMLVASSRQGCWVEFRPASLSEGWLRDIGWRTSLSNNAGSDTR